MSVRKSLAWSYAAQAFIFLQSFAVTVIVARLLGPYEMGIYAVGAATAGALAVLSAFGIGSYVVRHPSPDAALRTTAFTVNAIVNSAVSVAIVTTVLVGARWGLIKEVRHVLLLLAATPLIAVFEFLPSTFLQREMNFRVISVISMCRALINGCVLLPLAWYGLGYLSLAIATVCSTLFSAVAYNVVARRHVGFRFGLKGWRDLTKFGMQMMSIGGLAALMQRLSELMLGHFLGVATLGIYTRASSLANQIWENVYGLSTRVVFAQMAKELRETDSLQVTYVHGLTLISAVLGPLFVGLMVLSRPLIQALYGSKWTEAADPLAVLMMACLVTLGFSMNWELCVLRHRTGWQARNEGIRALFGTAAFAIGASISLGAAAVARVVDALCGLALYGPQMPQMVGVQRGQLYRIYRQSAALALAAAGPSMTVMASTGWSPRTSWAFIAPAVGIGVVLWFALLRQFRHPLLVEMRRAARFAINQIGGRTA